jgi:hypothetical protein
MPLGLADTLRPGGVQQLLACASLAALDDMLAAVGLVTSPSSSRAGAESTRQTRQFMVFKFAASSSICVFPNKA